MPAQTIFKKRRGTAAEWVSTNPILASGEEGYETDTGFSKIGDGVLAWDALDYQKVSRVAEKVKNQTGSTIAKGAVVYISGATGDEPLISLADADTEVTSSKTLGLSGELIADGATGEIITQGFLRGVNTAAATNGDAVWLSSTAGQFVFGNPPAKPAHAVYLGVVIRAHATQGTILVKVQNGYELNELHDVNAGSPSAGDALVWNGTAWVNQQVDVSGAIAAHNSDTTDVHGIADTSLLATKSYVDTAADTAYANANAYTDTAVANLVDAAPATLDTLNELAAALGDDANFAATVASSIGTKQDALVAGTGITLNPSTDEISVTANTYDAYGSAASAQTAAEAYTDSAVSAHNLDATNVHGIADTSALETQTGAQAKADAALAAANLYSDSLAVNYDAAGAASTAQSNANTYTDSEVATALTTAQGYADTAEADAKAYADSLAVNYDTAGSASAAQTAAQAYADSALSTHNAATTSVHGIADTSLLATKAYADNAAATAAAAVVDAAPATLDTLNELAAALGDDANYAATVTAALGAKQDKVNGVSDTEIGYLSNVTSDIQAQLDAGLSANAPTITNPTFNVSVSGGENYTSVDEIINPAISGSFKISNYSAIPPFSVGDIVTFINSPRNNATIDGMNFEVVDSGFDNVFETYFVRVAAVNTSDNSTVDTWVGFGGGAPSGFSMSTVSSKTITPANIGHLDAPTITNPTFTISGSSTYETTSVAIYPLSNPGEVQIKIFSPSGLPSIATIGSTIYLTSTADPSLTGGLDIDNIDLVIDSVDDFGMYVQINTHAASSANNAEVDAYTTYMPYGLTSVVLNQASTKTISPTEISYLDGVTSNIQTQIDTIAASAGGSPHPFLFLN